MRIDKLNLAALDALLRLYLDPQRALARVPTLALLAQSRETLRERAARLREADRRRRGRRAAVAPRRRRRAAGRRGAERRRRPGARAGGRRRARRAGCARGTPAVVGHVHDGRLLLDLLAVGDDELAACAGAVRAALAPA